MSSCYQSLHIDTSKWRLAFEDYPVPADWPDFPHHYRDPFEPYDFRGKRVDYGLPKPDHRPLDAHPSV